MPEKTAVFSIVGRDFFGQNGLLNLTRPIVAQRKQKAYCIPLDI
jgi:hypothetical protein